MRPNGHIQPRRVCVKVTFDSKPPESAWGRRQQAAKRRRLQWMLAGE
jgi:hypothetical protein